jgi:hypothetical protein
VDGLEAQDWNFHIVDDVGFAGAHSQIAVTSDGTPYILYENTDDSRILLAWWVSTGGDGGGWEKMEIGTSHYNYNCEIIADSEDHLHMAWENSSSLRYGVYDPDTETWIIPEEEVSSSYGWLDLAIVEHNDTITAYIVYTYRYSPYDLRLATRDPVSETWSTEVIHGENCNQTLPSIAADSQGRLHVSFRETASMAMMYATNANDSTTWVTEYVELGSNLGQYSSIVVDDYDVPYIIYYDASNGDLKYARMISE